MHIADATATWLARMDVAVPPEFAGRVLYEALGEVVGTTESGAHVRALPDLPASRALRDDSAADEARVEARLRALGYVD